MAMDERPCAGMPVKVGRVFLPLFLACLCFLVPGCMGVTAVQEPPGTGAAAEVSGTAAVPGGVEARLTGRNAVTVSWREEFRDASGYVVERSAGNGFAEIARVEKGTGRFIDTRLSPSVTYSYRVCACNSRGRSGFSRPASVTTAASSGTILIGHECTELLDIPVCWIKGARARLHIALGGAASSQVVSGLRGLERFRGSLYALEHEAREGESLDLRDQAFGESLDVSGPESGSWVEATKRYLRKHPEVNVVMWSWGAASRDIARNVEGYLGAMEALEQEHPLVVFVYVTAPLDGTGLEGGTHRANVQIRDFCIARGKVLYDFADIESYDPDGRYYGHNRPATDCSYDADMDGRPDANWAADWQSSHREGADWYDCESPTTMALNANLKASAAWWLMARLAGWKGE